MVYLSSGNKKEKEIAKKQGAKDTAMKFFKGPGSSLLSLTDRNGSLPSSSLTTFIASFQGETPSLCSFASPFPPSVSSNKYPPFTSPETLPNNFNSQSMHGLINSPLDNDEICYMSCQKSSEDTSPSSVGSLFKSSISVIQQADGTITCDDGSSKKLDGAHFFPADVTVQMVSQPQHAAFKLFNPE